MAVAYRSSSQNGSSSTTSMTVAVPSGITADDWVIAVLIANGASNNIADANSGQSTVFTQEITEDQTGGGGTMSIWYRKADSNDVAASNYTFTCDIARATWIVAAFSGGLTGSTPWDVTPSGSTSNIYNSLAGVFYGPNITVDDNTVHIAVATQDTGSGSWDATPTGYSEIETHAGAGSEAIAYYKDYVTGDATGTTEFGVVGTRRGQTQSFSLASAAGGPIAPTSTIYGPLVGPLGGPV